MNYSAVFWDWNGTIFDDLDLCYNIYCELACTYEFTKLSKREYRHLYSFPLEQFFRDRGYHGDIITFANAYRELYTAGVAKCRIHPSVRKLLRHFHKKGVPQHIVSAHNHHDLVYMVNRYKLDRYFSSINGLYGIEGGSKKNLACSVINREELSGESVLFIGDTAHDYEVAQSINADSWLIADGHSAVEQLSLCDYARVFDSLTHAMEECKIL